jgi:hypothetical protein
MMNHFFTSRFVNHPSTTTCLLLAYIVSLSKVVVLILVCSKLEQVLWSDLVKSLESSHLPARRHFDYLCFRLISNQAIHSSIRK